MTIDPAVQQVVDAANNADVDAFLDAFTENGAVDDWGRVFRGRDAIRGWSDKEFIGVQASLEVTAVDTVGSEVTVTARVGGNGFNGPSHFAFTLEAGRIALMRITA